MWADIVYAAERFFYLRVLVWGALSAVAGTALLVATSTRLRSGLLSWFAGVCVSAGILELIFAAVGYANLSLRDLSGAAHLERMAWLELGLWFGLMALGVTLAVVGWKLARSVRSVGAGVAITIQALALAILNLQLIAVISR